MRRTLFGKSAEVERLTPAHVSVIEALVFDILDHQSSADQSLIERRVGSWSFAPWLLLTGHLIIGISLLLQEGPSTSWAMLATVFVPLGLSLALDALAGTVLIYLAPAATGAARRRPADVRLYRRDRDSVRRCRASPPAPTLSKRAS